MIAQGHLATRDRIIAELHDLGESDATKSPVGTIVDARVIEPEGGLYVIAQISEGLTGLAHLVRSGFMTGLSLSTVENHTGLVPVEVSLTSDPARPHSYIVHSSSSYERAQDYLRGIETGTLRDYSASLTKPTRVMAASKQQMEVETPAEAPKVGPLPSFLSLQKAKRARGVSMACSPPCRTPPPSRRRTTSSRR